MAVELLRTQSSVGSRTTPGCTEAIFASLVWTTGTGKPGGLREWPAGTEGWTSALGFLLPPPLEGPEALPCRLWAGAHSTALPLTGGSNRCLPG